MIHWYCLKIKERRINNLYSKNHFLQYLWLTYCYKFCFGNLYQTYFRQAAALMFLIITDTIFEVKLRIQLDFFSHNLTKSLKKFLNQLWRTINLKRFLFLFLGWCSCDNISCWRNGRLSASRTIGQRGQIITSIYQCW